MSKLDDLINELCPDGVEYQKLCEVCDMQRGVSLTKANSVEGEYPVISGGKEPAFYCNQYNRDGETITVAGSGAGAGFVQYWNQKIFVNDAFSVKGKENLSTKYVYYSLTNLQEQIYATKKGGGVPHVHISSIDKFEIPVPPLKVQNEIVRILDKFTSLEAELEAELEARRKQYEYYRDSLLTFGDDVEWKTLGELSLLITKGTTPKRFTENGIHFIKTEAFENSSINKNKLSFIDEETHEKELKRSILAENDLLITIAGATIGKCAIVPKEILPANTNQALAIVRLNQNVVNYKYVFYLIKSPLMKKYIQKKVKGSAQPNLTLQLINEFEIPLPSLEKQNEIVSILDRFESLCNDITSGLPAEIESRHKQYEYYRDKLLTFKRKEA